MTLNIFTALIFIAELIITYSLMKLLIRADKAILNGNNTILTIKPGIKDICLLIRKISEQLVEFSYDIVPKIVQKRDKVVIKFVRKLIITIILLKFNFKIIKNFLRSKPYKILSKGFSLLKYVV